MRPPAHEGPGRQSEAQDRDDTQGQSVIHRTSRPPYFVDAATDDQRRSIVKSTDNSARYLFLAPQGVDAYHGKFPSVSGSGQPKWQSLDIAAEAAAILCEQPYEMHPAQIPLEELLKLLIQPLGWQ